MKTATLEHANVTVSDIEKTAAWLCVVFNWKIRWRGESIYNGQTIHVGSADTYLALYSMGHAIKNHVKTTQHYLGGLNHVGIVVDDLEATEIRVKAAGFKPHSHADYEPGRRFYFDDQDGIEFEVVSYQT